MKKLKEEELFEDIKQKDKDGLRKKVLDNVIFRLQPMGFKDHERVRLVNNALDLKAEYVVPLDDGKAGKSMIITNKVRKTLEFGNNDLRTAAIFNTAEYYEFAIYPIKDMLKELGMAADGMAEIIEEMPQINMYVITSKDKRYGATALMYPTVFAKLADELQSDLLIIPSSIHEVIVIAEVGAASVEECKEMVMTVNETEVLPEERLSEHVYRYLKEDNSIEVACW